MNVHVKWSLGFAIFLFAPLQAASALTATYHFSGDTIPTNQILFPGAGTDPDLTVTARNFSSTTGNLFGSLPVGQYNGGLGVCAGQVTSSGDYCKYDDHQVDGIFNEMVLFEFDQVVTLESVRFSLIGGNDHFAFRMYSPNGQYFAATDPGSNGSPTYTFQQAWTGTVFGIGAQQGNDEFKIRKLTINYEPPLDNIPDVPVPAAFPLLAGGLGLMGLLGWRRKRKAVAGPSA